MNIYVSSNMFLPCELDKIFDLLELVGQANVGIELFPEWHDTNFADFVENNIARLKKYKISLHGTYFNTEHSARYGTEAYIQSMSSFEKTLLLAQSLDADYVVFHHNNRSFSNNEKPALIETAEQNLRTINYLADKCDMSVVIENAGVISRGNMLFTEKEFVEMAYKHENKILIDVGHAFANGWDIENVIRSLSDKIGAYHLHNNDGINDLHDRVLHGKMDFDLFLELYKKVTPEADLVIEYNRKGIITLEEVSEDISYIRKAIK